MGVREKVPDALLLRLADQRADVEVHRRRADAKRLEGVAEALSSGS